MPSVVGMWLRKVGSPAQTFSSPVRFSGSRIHGKSLLRTSGVPVVSWIWIAIDFAISGLLVLASVRMAFLGVHVTLSPPIEREKKKIRRKFVFWGAVAVCLAIAQSARNQMGQHALTDALNKLRSEAYVYLESPDLQLFQLGKPILVNVGAKNSGPGTALELQCLDSLQVVYAEPIGPHGEPMVPKDVANLAYERFEEALRKSPGNWVLTMGDKESRWSTAYGPTLDANLENDIRNGRKALLITSRNTWKDGTGPHGTEFCTWLQIPFDKIQIWHSCEVHDGVKF